MKILKEIIKCFLVGIAFLVLPCLIVVVLHKAFEVYPVQSAQQGVDNEY